MAIIFAIETTQGDYVSSSRNQRDHELSIARLSAGYFKPDYVQEATGASRWFAIHIYNENCPESLLREEKSLFRAELKAKGRVLLNKVDGKPPTQRKKQRSRTYGV